ncbi:MAG: altronate dehydratase [Firmicutes bacterium]|nr:altronate dehydratase [Bacillota bacterium]
MKKINDDLAIISKDDDVAIALKNLKKGYRIQYNNMNIELLDDIPFGHKVALKNIQKNKNITKYDYEIGKAVEDIKAGSHVHTHNVDTNLDDLLEYSYQENHYLLTEDHDLEKTTFKGYLREDGKAGTRNDIWIVPTVGCVNSTAKRLEKMAKKEWGDKFDDILAITHNAGCSQLGYDHKTTQKILKGIINHPNAGGVLVISLGCENNNLEEFKPVLGDINENRIKFLTTQNTEDEYKEGLKLIEELVEYAERFKREDISTSKLVIGFKCGGSDAFSGITANPLCGKINDKLVLNGGSTLLTEVPEMFGAETILMKRAKNKETFNKIVKLINDYKLYFKKYNQVIYENPAPGNKKGGITTLEEKSLGCIQKGGTAPVMGVLGYGDQISNSGLNLLTGSGNDPVSCTNLLASGAAVILFTTGRGNPFGAPVPTIKISSNSELYNKKPHWIDYNAGEILEKNNIDNVVDELWGLLLDVISGKKKTNNEIHGYKDISIFRDGVIL